jgi:hypothetical protein
VNPRQVFWHTKGTTNVGGGETLDAGFRLTPGDRAMALPEYVAPIVAAGGPVSFAIVLLRWGPDAILRLLAGTVAVLTNNEKRGKRCLDVLRLLRSKDDPSPSFPEASNDPPSSSLWRLHTPEAGSVTIPGPAFAIRATCGNAPNFIPRISRDQRPMATSRGAWLHTGDHQLAAAVRHQCWSASVSTVSAEGVGFEPTSKVTPASGFQDRRHRPLGEPSRLA